MIIIPKRKHNVWAFEQNGKHVGCMVRTNKKIIPFQVFLYNSKKTKFVYSLEEAMKWLEKRVLEQQVMAQFEMKI